MYSMCVTLLNIRMHTRLMQAPVEVIKMLALLLMYSCNC